MAGVSNIRFCMKRKRGNKEHNYKIFYYMKMYETAKFCFYPVFMHIYFFSDFVKLYDYSNSSLFTFSTHKKGQIKVSTFIYYNQTWLPTFFLERKPFVITSKFTTK